jgi:hypothetical protein
MRVWLKVRSRVARQQPVPPRPLAHLDVAVLVVAFRRARIEQVGQRVEERGALCLQLVHLGVRGVGHLLRRRVRLRLSVRLRLRLRLRLVVVLRRRRRVRGASDLIELGHFHLERGRLILLARLHVATDLL